MSAAWEDPSLGWRLAGELEKAGAGATGGGEVCGSSSSSSSNSSFNMAGEGFISASEQAPVDGDLDAAAQSQCSNPDAVQVHKGILLTKSR